MSTAGLRVGSLLVGIVSGSLFVPPCCFGQPPVPPIQEQDFTLALWAFRSDNLELNTDLSPAEAVKLLSKLEQLVSNLNVYWGEPLKGRIRCFVVADLSRWPESELAAEGRMKIEEKSGTTITLRSSLDGQVQSVQSIVYAAADGRTPLHEAVHAYCWQTFGRCGPEWFAEGMAEVGAYWRSDRRFECPVWMVNYLRSDTRATPKDILSGELGNRKPWQVYAHRWALCQLLVSNPRYSERFRQYSRDLLQGRQVDFAERFPELKGTLATDYRAFLTQLESTYHTAQKTASD